MVTCYSASQSRSWIKVLKNCIISFWFVVPAESELPLFDMAQDQQKWSCHWQGCNCFWKHRKNAKPQHFYRLFVWHVLTRSTSTNLTFRRGKRQEHKWISVAVGRVSGTFGHILGDSWISSEQPSPLKAGLRLQEAFSELYPAWQAGEWPHLKVAGVFTQQKRCWVMNDAVMPDKVLARAASRGRLLDWLPLLEGRSCKETRVIRSRWGKGFFQQRR